MARRRKSLARVPLNTYVLRDLRVWLVSRAEKEVRSLSQYVEMVLDEHRRTVEAASLVMQSTPKSEDSSHAANPS